MNERERKALANVINYLWADEKKHAECEGNPDGHICRELQVLQDYLAAGADDAMKALARHTLDAMKLAAYPDFLDELVDIGVMEQVQGGGYTWTEKGKMVRAVCSLV